MVTAWLSGPCKSKVKPAEALSQARHLYCPGSPTLMALKSAGSPESIAFTKAA